MNIAANTKHYGYPDQSFHNKEQQDNDPDTFEPFKCIFIQFQGYLEIIIYAIIRNCLTCS